MRRREFISLVGGAVVAAPFGAAAQQNDRVRRSGWLSPSLAGVGPQADRLNAFKRGLAELGWLEGRNVVFEERWTGEATRLPSGAAELAARRPDLIFVSTSPTLA